MTVRYPLACANHGEANSRVTRRSFDDGLPRSKLVLLSSASSDDAERGAVPSTEPPGFMNSRFAENFAAGRVRKSSWIRIRGVLPT